ncbi:MAG TPA: hypothetical protein PLB02_13900, partial [Thermoanaerobaculia bacterium]|nr:hypothetical protein [Thermoanaerobaculia bacterium]
GAESRPSDALFLAAAPAWIPDENEPELAAMAIGRLYVAAASLRKDGKIVPLPPPPTRLTRPVVLAVMGEPSAASVLAGGSGASLGAAWAQALGPVLADAKGWADVVGVLLHLDPAPENAGTLADAVRALRSGLGGLPVSVTVRGTEPAASWKPLAGAVEEVLLFSFGRRPELGDRLVPEISDETAKEMPVPFRILLAPGGFGRGGDGKTFTGRWIPDGEIDALSEDRSLDFSFGQVLSEEAGSLYTFKLRPGVRLSDSRLAAEGGAARFQILAFSEAVRLLGLASRWGAPKLLGRVFLLEGIPRDPHLTGYAAVRSLLEGKALDLKLQLESRPGSSGAGWTEFSVRVTNLSPTPSDLSRYNNWIQARVEGGVFSSVKIGNLDRFELLASQAEGYRPAPLGQAVVARLFENLFAPGETKETEAIRVSGARPKVFLSWRLTGPDGKIGDGPETEASLDAPAPKSGRR